MLKKKSNKTTKEVVTTSSWAESKPKTPVRNSDQEDDNSNTPAPATTKNVAPSVAKAIPQQLSPVIKTQLSTRLAEINEYIKHFRNLGYYTRADGTLAEPEQLVITQTNVPAKIIMEGNRFYLDVGTSRKHNELIKKLGGHWISYKSAWKFDSIALLQNVRDSFDITEEIQGTYTYSSSAPTKRKDVKHDGKIVLEEMGMYIIIRGDTKPIKDDLKAIVQNLRWDAEEGHWVANKQYKAEIEEKLAELQEEGRITSWEYETEDAE